MSVLRNGNKRRFGSIVAVIAAAAAFAPTASAAKPSASMTMTINEVCNVELSYTWSGFSRADQLEVNVTDLTTGQVEYGVIGSVSLIAPGNDFEVSSAFFGTPGDVYQAEGVLLSNGRIIKQSDAVATGSC